MELGPGHANHPVVSACPWLSPRGQGAGWEDNHVGEEGERALPLKDAAQIMKDKDRW